MDVTLDATLEVTLDVTLCTLDVTLDVKLEVTFDVTLVVTLRHFVLKGHFERSHWMSLWGHLEANFEVHFALQCPPLSSVALWCPGQALPCPALPCPQFCPPNITNINGNNWWWDRFSQHRKDKSVFALMLASQTASRKVHACFARAHSEHV